MKTGIIKRLSFAAVVAGLGIAMAMPAQATLSLRLTSGGSMATVVDGDADGVVVFNGGLGGTNWTVNVTTGISKPTLGSATAAVMDLNSVNVSSTGGGSIMLELTDTDFMTSSPSSFQMEIGGTTRGSLTYSAYLDAGNGAFVQGTLIDTLGPFAPVAFSGSANGGGPFFQALPYSLTQIVNITHTAAGQVSSFNAELRAVPEPGSLALFGMSIFGFGLALRRRLRPGQAS